MDQNLEVEASSPQTAATRLQELARDYPNLRPLIALNPSTYPELLGWLGKLSDPAVKLALEQRAANAQAQTKDAPGRVSIMGRAAGPEWAPVSAAAAPEVRAAGAPGAPVTPDFYAAPAMTASAGERPNDRTIMASDLSQINVGGRKVSKRLATILIIVLALALVVGLVIFMLGRGGNSHNSVVTPGVTETIPAAPQSEGQQSDHHEQPQSDGADAKGDEAKPVNPNATYPAPENALVASKIVSPSGNIACELGDSGARCTIMSSTIKSDDTAACEGQPITMETTDSLATIGCTSPQVSADNATVLSYGDYAASGNAACYSLEQGMTCWNTQTGSSFALARGGYWTGGQGPLGEQPFPWLKD